MRVGSSLMNRPARFVLAVAIGCCGCSRSGNSELRVPDGTPIVLISIDTLRSDRLPAYGYSGVQTPAIDRLRKDGILFEHAYTNVPLTLPAHLSLLSGLLPPDHGVHDNLGYTFDAATAPLMQQTLKGAGYATGAAVSAFVLRRATGIGAGFDFYQDEFEAASGPGIQAIQRPGRATLEVTQPWLRSVADSPFFLFFHIFEPHSPYQPPAKYSNRYPSLYDGEVAAADEVVGDLVEELRNLGAYDRALVVLLSDHGEGLGDHGEDEHGLFLYRSTLQVPMMMKLPHAARAGDSIDSPVELIDVYPTVLSALGLADRVDLPGTPLLALPSPRARTRPIYSETFFPRLHFGWSDLVSVIVGRHHYIDAPQPELYDLEQDPAETDNLVGREPTLEAELRTVVEGYDRRLAEPGPTEAETRRRLAALGYVGGASTVGDEILPDPKTRVGALAKIQSAYRLYADGDFAGAASAFSEIVAENPGIDDAWEYLALAYLRLGRLDAAVKTYRTALETLPRLQKLSLGAARFFYQVGLLDDAFVQANIAIPYDPVAAHTLLAEIALKRGDPEGAEAEAREAMNGNNRQPGPRLLLADILVARGDPEEAAGLLEATLDEGIRAESVYAKLAVTYVWLGDLEKAEESLKGLEETDDLNTLLAFGRLASARERWGEARGWFERALAADPNNPTVKLNLGIVALTEGRVDDAENNLAEAVVGLPGSFEAWNALGVARVRQGDLDGAVEAWENAHRVDPGVVDVLFNLGLAHAQAGRLSVAADYLETYASRAEGPQRERALAMAQNLRRRAAAGE
jgi:arylsulfatase A-like enzyme/Tfp pilus assembly protein PilF